MAELGVEVSSQLWSRLFHHLSWFCTILDEWSSHLYSAFLGVPVKGPLEQVSFNVRSEHSFEGAFQMWSKSLFFLVRTHAQTNENTHTHIMFAAPSTFARRTKEPPDESERGEWKSWLKTQHSKNEDHGICPITSWQIDGETMETVTDFIFLGTRISADGHCSHKIKRYSLEEKLWPT